MQSSTNIKANWEEKWEWLDIKPQLELKFCKERSHNMFMHPDKKLRERHNVLAARLSNKVIDWQCEIFSMNTEREKGE